MDGDMRPLLAWFVQGQAHAVAAAFDLGAGRMGEAFRLVRFGTFMGFVTWLFLTALYYLVFPLNVRSITALTLLLVFGYVHILLEFYKDDIVSGIDTKTDNDGSMAKEIP